MDHDQQLQLLYLLAILILRVTALMARLRRRREGARPFTVQDSDQTFSGLYWVEGGIVYVHSEAGRRGRPLGPEGSLRTAEQLLLEIHRADRPVEQSAP